MYLPLGFFIELTTYHFHLFHVRPLLAKGASEWYGSHVSADVDYTALRRASRAPETMFCPTRGGSLTAVVALLTRLVACLEFAWTAGCTRLRIIAPTQPRIICCCFRVYVFTQVLHWVRIFGRDSVMVVDSADLQSRQKDTIEVRQRSAPFREITTTTRRVSRALHACFVCIFLGGT